MEHQDGRCKTERSDPSHSEKHMVISYLRLRQEENAVSRDPTRPGCNMVRCSGTKYKFWARPMGLAMEGLDVGKLSVLWCWRWTGWGGRRGGTLPDFRDQLVEKG